MCPRLVLCNENIVFASVCLDEPHEVATYYEVKNIPTFIFFYRDHVQNKFTGLHYDKFNYGLQKLDAICGGESKDPDEEDSAELRAKE